MTESTAGRRVSVQALVSDDTEPIDWKYGVARIAEAENYWLATLYPDGHPHSMPLLAVEVDGLMHFCTNASTRKGRNLQHNNRCALSASSGGFDLVINGRAVPVAHDSQLQRIAEAYNDRYGWRVSVRDGAFHDAEGAPTAGPPPYYVYSLVPETAFAFGTREDTMNSSTRWGFQK